MKTTHLALVLALLAPACSGSATNVPAQTQQTAATKAPLSVTVVGPLRHVADAFAEVPLRPEQRTEIESMLTSAQQRHAALKPLAKDVMMMLADQVEKGAIDEVALKPKIDAAVAAYKPVQIEDRKAVQRAHDLLDASQRAALVDSMETLEKARFGFVGKHKGEQPHEEGEHEGMHGMGMIGKELNLTLEQKTKLMEAMKEEWQAAREHAQNSGEHHKFGEWRERREKAHLAFKGDAFDIDKDVPVFDAEKGANHMLQRGVHFAKTALPILTPEQRVTAAKLIRERSEKIGELH